MRFAVDVGLRGRQAAEKPRRAGASAQLKVQLDEQGMGISLDEGESDEESREGGVGEVRDDAPESTGRFEAPAVDYESSDWWSVGHKANDSETVLNRVQLLKFKLGRLDLAGLGLLHPLPTVIFTPGDLQSLQLQENNLVALSPAISWARNLRQLRLFSNQLVMLPEEIGLLPRLEMLWLHDNHLTAIPASVGNLTALKFLTLRTNCLTALPYTLHQLQKLQELDWQGNNIMDPPELVHRQGKSKLFEFMRCMTISRRSSLLSFDEWGFPAITKWMIFPGLTLLSLRNNPITGLPLALVNVASSLTHLDVRGCPIDILPTFLGRMTSLASPTGVFKMDWHRLAFPPRSVLLLPLPRVIEFMRRIEESSHTSELTLSGFSCLQGEIPPDIWTMTHLAALSLDDTRLHELPGQLLAQPVNLKGKSKYKKNSSLNRTCASMQPHSSFQKS
jgi:Leucine-rich repeat (LRR) protein